MRKCGFHVQQTSNELRQAIEAVQPTLIVSLAHDRDFWRAVKTDFGETFLIGRLFEIREGFSPDWREVDPRLWADECASLAMCYDAWITRNEPDGIDNQVTAEDAKRHDEWCVKFRERALELGFEAVGPNIAAGNLHGGDIVKWLPNLCKTFKYVARHEYSARAMWDQAPALERSPNEVPQTDGEERGWWYTLTYRGWKRAICESYPWREGQFQVVISEGGVAYGVIPDEQGQPKYGDVGWQTDMSEEQYVESLKWYTERANEDDYCLGWAAFMVGAADPKWNSFETLHLWPVLARFPETEPEPLPENGGNGMKVYNMEGKELGESAAVDLLAKYGAAFSLPTGLKDGDYYYAVTKVWEKTGHASFVASVRDRNGQPVVNPDEQLDPSKAHRAFWWRNMGEANDIAAPYATDRETEADLGGLDANGTGGSGFGTGAYTGEYESPEDGPHRAWIRHPTIPSVEFVGVRMLGMTNHDHLDAEWQEVQHQGEEPPTGDLAAEVDAIADRLKEIAQQMGDGITEIVVKRTGAADQVFVKKAESGVMARIRALLGR